jgi:ABC-2 type transport system permease protein
MFISLQYLTLNKMLSHLILFEWKFYRANISFYVMLASFFGLGILIGISTSIAFPNINYNSPYTINFILGLFSLASLFPIVIMTSQSLLREKDNRFEQILYSTPITIRNYFISKFSLVLGVAVFTFLLFLAGYMLSHLIKNDSTEKWGVFHLNYYLNPFMVIVLPNIYFCTVIICCTAWFSKNRMFIYLSGLGIYALYMVVSLFSNSPLFAGASPVSASAMNLAAKLDPFGMAAFFEQTKDWTSSQKNTEVLHLSGKLLFNRIAFVLLALLLLLWTYKSFQFKISRKHKRKVAVLNDLKGRNYNYLKATTSSSGRRYSISTILSFLKIDLKSVIKSLPFVLLISIVLFILGMEMYEAIAGGMRLPQHFVTTGLMVNTILTSIPFLLVFAILFYGSELIWKSKSANFSALENVTPFSGSAVFVSKILSVSAISFLLILCCILLGILFQVMYQYPTIEWGTYFSLFYFIGFPVFICSVLIVALQYLFESKYLALSIAVVFLMLTNTSLGIVFGISHPLVRFAGFLPDVYSEMNGFGYYPNAFIIKMIYSLSFVLLLSFFSISMISKSEFTSKKTKMFIVILPFITLLSSGLYISAKSNSFSDEEMMNWKQHYEEKYKIYEAKPQPVITDIKTIIDLFPETNSYKVSGTYLLVNKTNSKISEILINTSNDLMWKNISSPQLILTEKDGEFGQYIFKTKERMLPNDTIKINFEFDYKIESLKGHQSFNAIVENGAFMRISNYFPTIGYDSGNEIEDVPERKKRNMPLQDELTKLDAAMADPYEYKFINIDAIVSTSLDQTALFVGESVNSYSKNNRNYFHYQAKDIPFRFAVSSAKYEIEKSTYNDIIIEVFYEPNHYQNIPHLISNIKKSLHYCETNFGKYPYTTIRFAEISSFTSGFAATAYPATIFINERQFHIDLSKGTGQDIISELIGHELSHQWWGNAQFSPDYREGSGVLTETLAQYTQLMLYKNEYGENKMLEMVSLHQDLYNSEKAYSGEESLITSNPSNINVIYNKGLAKMHELYVLIGERKINLALGNLFTKHKFPFQPATTLDLIAELKAVSDVNKHIAIEKIFTE